jgi:hypothetical protein
VAFTPPPLGGTPLPIREEGGIIKIGFTPCQSTEVDFVAAAFSRGFSPTASYVDRRQGEGRTSPCYRNGNVTSRPVRADS